MRILLSAAIVAMTLPMATNGLVNAKPREIVVVGSTIKPLPQQSSSRRWHRTGYNDITLKRGVMLRRAHPDFLWQPRR